MDSLGASGASAEPPHAAWVNLVTACAVSHPAGRSGLLPEEQARRDRVRLARRGIGAFIDESPMHINELPHRDLAAPVRKRVRRGGGSPPSCVACTTQT